MSLADTSPDLDRRVIDLVREYWEEHRTPLLLSRLGGQEDGSIARLAKQRAGSLAAYLRTGVTGHVRVIQHSTKHAVIGVIPADTETDANDDAIDALLERTQDQAAKATPRFHPAFWTAFRVPLEISKRRYMSIQAPIRFQDGTSEERPDGFVEIEQKYIVGPDVEAAEVEKTVQNWLSDNKMDKAQFLWKTKTDTARLPPNDLLGRLLLSLETDDLRRISMPLDIVSKLRREPL